TGVDQGVAEPANRADHVRVAVVELAPKIADIRLDGIGVAGESIIPDVLQDLMLGEDTAGIEHEVAEQPVLGRGEGHLVVEGEVADREQSRVELEPTRAAEHRFDAQDELLQTEGFGQVVVAATSET